MDAWDFKMMGLKDKLDILMLKERFKQIKAKEK